MMTKSKKKYIETAQENCCMNDKDIGAIETI